MSDSIIETLELEMGVQTPELNVEETYTSTAAPSDAKMLPQLQTSSFASQLFWLTLCFVALYLLMARRIVPKIHEVMDKRRHRIEQDIDRADILSEEATKAREDYEAVYEASRLDAQKVITETQLSIKTMQETRQAETDEEINRMIQNAQSQMQENSQSLYDDLLPIAKDLATDVVKVVAGQAPSSKLVNDAVSNVAKSS